MPDRLLINQLSSKAETQFYALVKISIVPIVPKPSSNQLLKQHHTRETPLDLTFSMSGAKFLKLDT